jgi:hypothetical protein
MRRALLPGFLPFAEAAVLRRGPVPQEGDRPAGSVPMILPMGFS